MNNDQLASAGEAVRQQGLAQDCLLAYMMQRAAESLTASGDWVFRADFTHHLNVASVGPLVREKPMTRRGVAVRVEHDGYDIMRASNVTENLHVLMLALSMLAVKVVDERLWHDATNQAVLQAMALLQEWEESTETWSRWRPLAKAAMGRMLNRARDLGYFIVRDTVLTKRT